MPFGNNPRAEDLWGPGISNGLIVSFGSLKLSNSFRPNLILLQKLFFELGQLSLQISRLLLSIVSPDLLGLQLPLPLGLLGLMSGSSSCQLQLQFGDPGVLPKSNIAGPRHILQNLGY